MARIRTIKPEFPQSESIGRLSRDARLLFVQLWTLCDDEGRTRASSRMLASLLYPYDEDAPSLIEGWLHELDREGCIELYSAEDATYLQVTKWLKHQKIDRASKSKLPGVSEGSRIFIESSRGLVRGSGPGPGPSSVSSLRSETVANATPTIQEDLLTSQSLPRPPINGAASKEVAEEGKQPDPKTDLFRRSKEVLGPKASGSITSKLLKSCGTNENDHRTIATARARIEESSTKANPVEWLMRVINGPRRAANPYPDGII